MMNLSAEQFQLLLHAVQTQQAFDCDSEADHGSEGTTDAKPVSAASVAIRFFEAQRNQRVDGLLRSVLQHYGPEKLVEEETD